MAWSYLHNDEPKTDFLITSLNMKTNSITLLFLSAVFLLSGCKKDKDPDQASANRLQGKWEAITNIEKVYQKAGNKQVSEQITPIKAGQQLIEYKGNEAVFYENGEINVTYTYTITGNKIRLRIGNEGMFYQINFISDTQHSYIEETFYTDKNKVEMRSTSEIVYQKK